MMKQQRDSKSELRAAGAMREIENAKRSIQIGPTGIIMRVTLVLVFMYLIMASYLMLGIAGPILISVLFLISFFVPYFYQALNNRLKERRAQKVDRRLGGESPYAG